MTNHGNPRTPDQWGALRAWGWGVSKLVDYFESNPDSMVDPRKIGIEGVSRYGKAAIVAAAFDPRVGFRVRHHMRGQRRRGRRRTRVDHESGAARMAIVHRVR